MKKTMMMLNFFKISMKMRKNNSFLYISMMIKLKYLEKLQKSEKCKRI